MKFKVGDKVLTKFYKGGDGTFTSINKDLETELKPVEVVETSFDGTIIIQMKWLHTNKTVKSHRESSDCFPVQQYINQQVIKDFLGVDDEL